MNVHPSWLDAIERVFAIEGTLIGLLAVIHSPELAARLSRRSVLVDGYLEDPEAVV